MEVIAPTPEDYPRTLLDFERRFSTEEGCEQYLARLRWPGGFRCPRCQAPDFWTKGRGGLLECVVCHYQASVTAGTIFHRTRLPLQLWFRAAWFVTSQKNGASALTVQRQLGLQRYETVWTMLHKLRRAMVRPGRDRLSGRVEVDETFVGGQEQGVRGRETMTKSLVVVAAEEKGDGIGRIRLQAVPDGAGCNLMGFVEEAVEPGSVVHTDAWDGYRNVSAKGYRHEVTNIKRSGQLGHEVLPRVHRVASLLKRWWLGTHQGSIRPLHLDYYLDEFTFRFNRRTSRSRGKLFFRLIQQAVEVEPVYWRDIADGERAHHHNI
jgi:transposase-like protein/Zn ribbon nucleic-acid-binding protein